MRASTLRSIPCVRSASPRCANATTTRCPARTSPASSFSASLSPRAAIAGRTRLERVRLAARERVELGHAGEVDASSQLLPDAAHLVRLPHEVGPAVERRDEVVGSRGGRGVVLLVRRELRLDEVEPPLGGGIDGGLLDRVQRALRERGERAHGLDLVAEELDPERLAARGREDVDETAADGELAAVVDPVDPLVAREREVLGELLEADLRPGAERDRRRPRVDRRHPFRERRRRGEDEPAGGEDVERPRTLADEVRRRLEPGLPADAATREQRDVLGAEQPPCGLGQIARVAVVGDEDDRRVARAPRAGRRGRAGAPARRSGHARAAPRRRPGGVRSRGAPRRASAGSGGPRVRARSRDLAAVQCSRGSRSS